MQSNTQLENLFQEYKVGEKDKHEIRQIFFLLPADKKNNLLRNFDALATRMNQIQSDINTEREILLGSAISAIESAINEVRLEKLHKKINTKTGYLKL